MDELTNLLDEGSQWLPWLTEKGVSIIVGILIFFIGKMIAHRISGWIEQRLLKSKVDKAVAGFASSILYALMFAGIVLMALGQIGVETTSFIAILGAAGLAVGLALQGSLSNFASGVLIILLRPFKTGDFVEVGGQMGTVDRIELFHTYLKTLDNRSVILPNSSVMDDTIINFSAHSTRRLDLTIGISYDADIRQARDLMKGILDSDERVLKDPAYAIFVSELADSSVNFSVRAWVNSSDLLQFKSDLLEKVKYTFDENGVGIPYPQMDVHLSKAD
ncbi:MAG: mechanosensitive ion channel protein [Marinomonas sp.]|uniref:mechanosensitive ion channel family protein n=1 Tax=Marinomonas communis TaxID=28254 RepID=UPI000C36A9AA|nr:mechanosensitive ion channel domain-containing protein [Marinomonas communis]MAF15130.1 mechanosensitive ion channel protein [Marinomonas sp.]MCC4275465.1 mechanosensitive ion channel [Marinomonas communis]RUM52006.1 MAG: mechanosensitive ion channel family protein [Marinomonas sp.]